MRRLAGILLVAIVAAVTPLAADLTITTVTTIEGAMMSAASWRVMWKRGIGGRSCRPSRPIEPSVSSRSAILSS